MHCGSKTYLEMETQMVSVYVDNLLSLMVCLNRVLWWSSEEKSAVE